MKCCPVCGDETPRPIRHALHHFRLVNWGHWQYWRGNIKTFGFWPGLGASITLSFPIINILWHWKHRKSRLDLRF